MAKTYHRTKFQPTLNDFLVEAKSLKNFTSSSGKRYEVKGFEKDEMLFRRLDAVKKTVWKVDLKDVYRAYSV